MRDCPPGCEDPPRGPTVVAPHDGATEVPLQADLSWSGGHPCEGETVTDDVYLDPGDGAPQTLVCDDTPGTVCDPGSLEPETRYSWRVAAKGLNGPTEGPPWHFTTRRDTPPDLDTRAYLPLILLDE